MAVLKKKKKHFNFIKSYCFISQTFKNPHLKLVDGKLRMSSSVQSFLKKQNIEKKYYNLLILFNIFLFKYDQSFSKDLFYLKHLNIVILC